MAKLRARRRRMPAGTAAAAAAGQSRTSCMARQSLLTALFVAARRSPTFQQPENAGAVVVPPIRGAEGPGCLTGAGHPKNFVGLYVKISNF